MVNLTFWPKIGRKSCKPVQWSKAIAGIVFDEMLQQYPKWEYESQIVPSKIYLFCVKSPPCVTWQILQLAVLQGQHQDGGGCRSARSLQPDQASLHTLPQKLHEIQNQRIWKWKSPTKHCLNFAFWGSTKSVTLFRPPGANDEGCIMWRASVRERRVPLFGAFVWRKS